MSSLIGFSLWDILHISPYFGFKRNHIIPGVLFSESFKGHPRLVVKLSQAHDVGVVLSTALGDLHQLVADRNGVLEEVCGEHSDLRRKLQVRDPKRT